MHIGPIRFVGGSRHNQFLNLRVWDRRLSIPIRATTAEAPSYTSVFHAWIETERYELRQLWYKSDGPHVEPTIYHEYHLVGADYDHAFDMPPAVVDGSRRALRNALSAVIAAALKAFPPKRRVGFFIPD